MSPGILRGFEPKNIFVGSEICPVSDVEVFPEIFPEIFPVVLRGFYSVDVEICHSLVKILNLKVNKYGVY